MEKIDWIEQQAHAHMRERDANWQLVDKQATQFLLLLLTGGGGALVLAASNKDYRIVLMSVGVWLFLIAGYLVFRCFKYGNYPSTHNEPKNLCNNGNKEWDLERLRWAELKGLQKRINEAKEIIFHKSEIVNQALVAVCFTPVIAFIFWQV